MKSRLLIIIGIIILCIVGSYFTLVSIAVGTYDIFNPVYVLYFPSIVKQLAISEGNDVICLDACGPCSAWGPWHILVDGECKIPDKVEDCYYGDPPMKWEFVNGVCILNPEFIEPNTIIIYDVVEISGARLAVTPSQMVMNLTNDNTVTFVNNGLTTVNIFDNSKGIWSFDNVKPSSQRTLIINDTGYYEFLIQNSLRGQQGRIAALSDDTNSLFVGIRAKMAQTVIGSYFGEEYDGLFSVSAGGLNPGITIGIDEKFQDKHDDAEKFYYEKYKKMIPFDIPITIEFGEPIRQE